MASEKKKSEALSETAKRKVHQEKPKDTTAQLKIKTETSQLHPV